ncbi:MAG: M20/M25/M40 family metallo-hydrolase [Chitinophagaceae bacterium]
MFRLFLFLLLLKSGSCVAQMTDSSFIRKIADEILVNGKAYDNLRVLCKTIGARLSGSSGMYKAEEWAEKTLKNMGADKVYLQECLVPRWVRGGKDEAVIIYEDGKGKPVKATLDVLAIGNTSGTGMGGIKAAVILIHDFEELENRKDEIKGKIVFYSASFNPRYVETGYAYGETGVYRRSGPSRAARYGALAIMTRSLSESTDNNPHTGATIYDTSLPKIPAVAMGLKDADNLYRLFSAGKKVEAYIKTMAHFLADTIGHNIIGELTGSELPNEYITVGGHLDSWDIAEGAHDDGAGCVQSMEVLRSLKATGYKPKHSIRVVLFANEENGLRGGNKYADEVIKKNEKHIFALESDNGGFTPRGFDFIMSAAQLTRAREWLPLFLPYGVYYFGNGGAGSDVTPLNMKSGIPVSELRPDSQRYFDLHHARNDIFENVNNRELALGAINMTALIYMVDRYEL